MDFALVLQAAVRRPDLDSDSARRRCVSRILAEAGYADEPSVVRARWRSTQEYVTVSRWEQTPVGPLALVGDRLLDGRFLVQDAEGDLVWKQKAAAAARVAAARAALRKAAQEDHAASYDAPGVPPRVRPRLAITADQVRALVEEHGSVAAAARHLGVSRYVLDHRLAEADGRPLPGMYRQSRRPGASQAVEPIPLDARTKRAAPPTRTPRRWRHQGLK